MSFHLGFSNLIRFASCTVRPVHCLRLNDVDEKLVRKSYKLALLFILFSIELNCPTHTHSQTHTTNQTYNTIKSQIVKKEKQRIFFFLLMKENKRVGKKKQSFVQADGDDVWPIVLSILLPMGVSLIVEFRFIQYPV